MSDETKKDESQVPPEELNEGDLEDAAGGAVADDAAFIGKSIYAVVGNTSDDSSFQSVSGLDSETEIVEFQDGDDIILRKRPTN